MQPLLPPQGPVSECRGQVWAKPESSVRPPNRLEGAVPGGRGTSDSLWVMECGCPARPAASVCTSVRSLLSSCVCQSNDACAGKGWAPRAKPRVQKWGWAPRVQLVCREGAGPQEQQRMCRNRAGPQVYQHECRNGAGPQELAASPQAFHRRILWSKDGISV